MYPPVCILGIHSIKPLPSTKYQQLADCAARGWIRCVRHVPAQYPPYLMSLRATPVEISCAVHKGIAPTISRLFRVLSVKGQVRSGELLHYLILQFQSSKNSLLTSFVCVFSFPTVLGTSPFSSSFHRAVSDPRSYCFYIAHVKSKQPWYSSSDGSETFLRGMTSSPCVSLSLPLWGSSNIQLCPSRNFAAPYGHF